MMNSTDVWEVSRSILLLTTATTFILTITVLEVAWVRMLWRWIGGFPRPSATRPTGKG